LCLKELNHECVLKAMEVYPMLVTYVVLTERQVS